MTKKDEFGREGTREQGDVSGHVRTSTAARLSVMSITMSRMASLSVEPRSCAASPSTSSGSIEPSAATALNPAWPQNESCEELSSSGHDGMEKLATHTHTHTPWHVLLNSSTWHVLFRCVSIRKRILNGRTVKCVHITATTKEMRCMLYWCYREGH